MDKNRKTRILFISEDCSLNGASLSLLSLLSNLDRKTFEPFVVVSYRGPLAAEIERLSITVYNRFVSRWIPQTTDWGLKHIKKFLGTLRARVWSIAKLIEKHKIDVVYTNTVTCIDGAVAAYITKKPHIWHIREHIRENHNIKLYIPGILIPWIVSALSDCVVVNSRYIHKHYKNIWLQRKMIVIYNGIDLEKFSMFKKDNVRLKQELGIPAETKLVAIVGAINANKGHDTFVKSARLVKTLFHEVAFVVVGDGIKKIEENIQKLVDDLGLRSSFFFLGNRKDIPNIMRSIDLLVLPSIREPFGRVLVEAMAAGKPVVATCSGGPEEIVAEGKTGFLVPVGDEKSMAQSIIKIIEDSTIGIALGQAGRQRAERFFNQDDYVRNVEKVITGVADKHMTKLPKRSETTPHSYT